MNDETVQAEINAGDIAVVGMAAHLPGADTIQQYWQNLQDGVESIRRLSEDDLKAAGEDFGRTQHRNYVPAASVLEGFENFDAEFFGLSPKEAAIMDPQHRQFLEVCWQALENAAHPPERFDGPVGVYAGCGMGSYFYFNICSNPDLVEDVGLFLLRHTGNDKDFLSTRVSHIFNLTGPSIGLQTACSTSLVAMHYACQALQSGECDMALAGGVTIELPHGRGYIFEEGEILSPDGHCYAFDARGQGTVFGSGAAVVVLRRLEDAIADGDHIWGVIKGTAINNDGAAKAGYLAPSVDGQANAIAEAHAMADVSADTIDYVECHGTGTYLGDPIEIAALTEAFQQTTNQTGFCRIGSVKTNIGHLDTAAGAASLIKTALSLHHGKIPPSLNFETPNPTIDFENSPFVVNTALTDWPTHNGPRRAGVNSLGVGGTNAHAVLQEAPARPASDISDWPFQILTVSGRSKAALDANCAVLAEHLRRHPEQPLADIAWTLKQGRRAFEKRRVLVAETHDEAADLLQNPDPRRVFDHTPVGDDPELVFMFPGGGAQYVGMARDLYQTEPVFQEWMDRGLDILHDKIDDDIRALWLAEGDAVAGAEETLKRPSAQLPLIMIVEYALAQLWMSWGVRPSVLVGHSMGENTAACLAGVISFEDCIQLVLLRGQLFDTVPAGGMLSVNLPLAQLKPMLGDDLDIASLNAPELTVVSGPTAALDRLEQQLLQQEVSCQRVAIDIAAHSRMLEPILAQFRAFLNSITLSAPTLPFLSNRTGELITDAQATDAEYWVQHLRGTVNFADCISTLAQNPQRIYLEMGPGKALSSLTQMNGSVQSQQVFSVLRHPEEDIEDDRYFLGIVGRLWAAGYEADWHQVWGDAKRHRLPLPGYQFQRSRYFIEPGKPAEQPASTYLQRTENLSDWGTQIHWRPRLAEYEFDPQTELHLAEKQSWLIFMDQAGLGAKIASRLRAADHPVIEVHSGDGFGKVAPDRYTLSAEQGRSGYDQLVQDLMVSGHVPTRVLHLWLYTDSENFRPGSSFLHRNLEQGFYSLFFLAQAIADENLPTPLHITAVTSGASQVHDEPLPYPEKATVIGPARVIPRELPGVSCAVLDVEAGQEGKNSDPALEQLAVQVLEDLIAPPQNLVAALRGPKRFEQQLRRVRLEEPSDVPEIKKQGVYLITGGFGGIGQTIAARLISDYDARIILLSHSPFPERADWDAYLKNHSKSDKISQRIGAVRRLEALGGEIAILSADVSNINQMQQMRQQAEARFGQINGVIHAAGLIDDAPLLAKSVATIEDVFTPKLHGTQVLEMVFADGDLDWLVLFASTSTVTAPPGQIDYVAANEYLNAYAKSRKGGKTKVVAINWGIWNQVGMAADAVAARDSVPEPDAPTPVAQPLLHHASFDAAGNRVFMADLTTDHWILDDHRTKSGTAILPGTGYIELAAQALSANGETAPFEIEDLLFLRPLVVQEGAATSIRVRLAQSDEGYEFQVQSRCQVDGKQGYQTHAQAAIIMGDLDAPAPVDASKLCEDCDDVRQAEGSPLRSPQEAHLNFGPRWRVLHKTALGQGHGVADLHLPDIAKGDLAEGYVLHPAMLDLATGWAMELIEGYQPDHLWVPVSYGSIQVFAPLPERILSRVNNAADNTQQAETAAFNVTICDPDGNICARISDFSIRRLDQAQDFAATLQPTVNELELDPDPGAKPVLSKAEEQLRHNLSQGILPDEGAGLFLRALAQPQAQIFVSSLDLNGLIQQTEAAALSTQTAAQSFERPQLETEYLEPRNDVERTLAGFWQQLLGVDRVGIQDSFFDLGGHSLIAVRLFSMVKKAYRVDFPISILFEAPTVEKCAALIADQIGGVGEDDQPQAVAPRPKRYQYLVPMHQSGPTTKTPFFLVAGMFGNVLNLRHLANLIGADRPFYGLQARGLYGGDAPHETLAEAARDYIAEIRQIQPHGPYLLGGFSGGGLTAYEIVHQLEAMGETVRLLVMLDTPLPVRKPLSRADRWAIQWQELRKKGLRYPLVWARNRIAWELSKRRGIETTEAAGQHFHNAEIEAAFLRALGRYEMKHWQGNAVLLRPPLVGHWQVGGGRQVDSQRSYVEEDNGWGDWIAGIEVIEVPGDHDSMVLEPNVRVMATALKRLIRKAERA
ncbi:MAG: polyketide synthase [Rhodobacterales bacterium]|nr:MAG: polyketide synthase [Rhodobacterales bacterium]